MRELINEGGFKDATNCSGHSHPRWLRVNTLLTTLDEQLQTTFAGFDPVDSLSSITKVSNGQRLLYIDEHIPNLVAVPARCDVSKLPAYAEGKIIFQDKASCFPAYLLNPVSAKGDCIDACAAPGNKTTHLAAILGSMAATSSDQSPSKIIACEKDNARSATLAKMVKLAGADKSVIIKPNQDFMRLDPNAQEFAHVTCLLLDPSCSGSGIVGRDEAVVAVHLPVKQSTKDAYPTGKKRKRYESSTDTGGNARVANVAVADPSNDDEETNQVPEQDGKKLQARLTALAGFQLRLLERAMAFPAAQRITYSTCSVHDEENEHVVVRALQSDVVRDRGWKILPRSAQVAGLQKWNIRGRPKAVERASQLEQIFPETRLSDVAEGCIRSIKNGEDGTMGFFVAGFVRDEPSINDGVGQSMQQSRHETDKGNDDDEWNGFDD